MRIKWRSNGHAPARATGERQGRCVALNAAIVALLFGFTSAGALAQTYGNTSGDATTAESETSDDDSVTTTITVTGGTTYDNVNILDTSDDNGTAVTVNVSTDSTIVQTANNDGTTETTLTNVTVDSDFDVDSGETITFNSSTISGGVQVDSGGTLKGTATFTNITNNSGGNVNPGSSPGIMTITGTFTNSGTLTIEIDGPTAGTGAGFHDQVLGSGGSAAFVAGGALAPITRGITAPANNNFTPIVGQGFTIVKDATVSGAFASVTQPSSGLLAGTQFDVVYNSTDITIYVTPTNLANLDSSGVALSSNQASTATALNAFRPTAGQRLSGDNKTIFDNLFPLSASELQVAYDQLSGSSTASVASSGVFTAQAVTDALDGRANHERILDQTGLSETASLGLSGGETAGGKGWAAWIKPIGQIGSVDDDGNGIGFDRQAVGVLLGVEGQSRDVVFGLAGGYVYEDLDFDSIGAASGNDAEINSYVIGAYAGATSGNFFGNASIGYTFKDIDTKRNINLGAINRSADGSTDGGLFQIAGKFGYTANLSGVILEPHAGLAYADFNMDGFTETGASNLNLSYGDQDHDSLQSLLGVRASKVIRTASGMLIVPEVRVGWEHELLDDEPEISATFAGGGGAFTTKGAEHGSDTAVFGLGVKFEVTDQFHAFADYNGRISADQDTHGISAGLRYKY